MTYPFEFDEMLLTERALDALGFTEYWSGSGEFGDRGLDLGAKVGDERLTSKEEYPKYFIYEMDGMDDVDQGYSSEPKFAPRRYVSKGFDKTLYFLHEMYEDILSRRTPEEVSNFIELTKLKGINMYPYIKSYIDYKSKV